MDKIVSTICRARGVITICRARGGHLVLCHLYYAQYLRLRPDLVTPYIVEKGVAHHVAPYTTEKSQSHRGILLKGHRGFSGEVTRSQPNFRQSQIVTPVAAISIAPIGVTTLCNGIIIDTIMM